MSHFVRPVVAALILMLLSACGGGGGGSNSSNAGADGDSSGNTSDPNPAPPGGLIARAGPDQSVGDVDPVVLDGSGSSSSSGSPESFRWQQVSGSPVSLNNEDVAIANFLPPQNCESTELEFELTVSDNTGSTHSDRVRVSLNPVRSELVMSRLEVAQTHVLPAAGKIMTTNDRGDSISEERLHAIGGRDAMALVWLDTEEADESLQLEGRTSGGEFLGAVALRDPAQLPPTESSGEQYSESAFSANLPQSWMNAGLELRAVGGCRQTPSAWNSELVIGADFEMQMRVLPFYLFGANEINTGRSLAATGTPPADAVSEMFAKWPSASLTIENHPAGKVEWSALVIPPRNDRSGVPQPAYVATQASDYRDGFAGLSTQHGIVSRFRRANGEATQAIQYYSPLLALNEDGNYQGPGGGIGGGGVGTGDDSYTGIFIHEAGHAFGIPHVGDAYDDQRYPYEWGSLNGSVWGFDQVRNEFLSVRLPSTASRFENCASQTFAGRNRALDSESHCIKQDPMQSGSGDQSSDHRYATFSDYSTGIMQRWFEGRTTVNDDGTHNVNSKIVVDASFPGGYKRWDTILRQWVNETDETTQGGILGLNKGLPIQSGVPVYSIAMTLSNAGTPGVTQIYPPIRFVGNLLDGIDPATQAGRDRIQPDTSELFWYCRNGGCDYSLRVRYADLSTYQVLIQGGFRPFNQPTGTPPASANVPTDRNSFRQFALNVPDRGEILRIELLHTPRAWEGFPLSPTVLATR